ncbi:hypothetical protein D3C76_1232410 [compost metagenome]
MNDVFQFAGIARPAVQLQYALGGVTDQRYWQVQAWAVDTDKILGQRQDIANPIA